MRELNKIVPFIFLFSLSVYGQSDSLELPYTSYRCNPILFNDIGLSDAPATIKYPFSDQVNKIQLRHNNKLVLGIGFSYNWLAIRIGAALIGNTKSVSQYGKSRYLDIGTQFSIKRIYAEADLRYYEGYVIKNALVWDPKLSISNPNDKEQDITVSNISAKMWYLHNRNFRMDPFTGNRGVYNKQVMTWHIAGRLDRYKISNNIHPLVPSVLRDSTNTKTNAESIGALEIGAIPGYAYVNRIKKIQFGIIGAIGPRIQFKSYSVLGEKTTLTSVVARYDLKAIVGYNTPKFFAMLHLEVDNKSIHFSSFKYNQAFFYMKVQTGYRFEEKLPKKRKKKKSN